MTEDDHYRTAILLDRYDQIIARLRVTCDKLQQQCDSATQRIASDAEILRAQERVIANLYECCTALAAQVRRLDPTIQLPPLPPLETPIGGTR